MNKGIIFTIGAIAGAAIGSVGTYFLMKDRMEEVVAEEIDNYIQYFNDKKRKESENSEVKNDEEETDKEDKKIYKYYKGGDFENPVKKSVEENKVTEGDKAFVEHPTFEPENTNKSYNLEEITEEDFENDDTYEKEVITLLIPQDELYYGYNTDNQELAESHYNVGREALIGQMWRWATDYTNNESGVGTAYIRNHGLKKLFEVTVIVDLTLEDQYVPVD